MMHKYFKPRITDGKLTLFRLLLAFLCSLVLRSVYYESLDSNDNSWLVPVMDLLGLALQLSIFACMVGIMIYPNPLPLRSIWRRAEPGSDFSFSAYQVLALVILALFLRHGAGIISQIYMQIFQPEKFSAAISGLQGISVPSLFPSLHDFEWKMISAIILAPIFEEILYRGFILNFLLSKYKPIGALLISSVVFAIFHGSGYFSAFLGGLYIGALYILFGRLDICIFAHAIGNLLASTIERLFFGQLVIYDVSHFSERPLAVCLALISILVYVGFLAVCIRTFKTKMTNSAFAKWANQTGAGAART